MEIFPKRAAKKERREKRGRNDLLALEPAGPPLLSKRKRERERERRKKKKKKEEEFVYENTSLSRCFSLSFL